ncbi:MAG: hypothetical protein JSR17_03170 [Proteobacteria bacterium]|nr:hypothetical protein [Pseudomonadota bacterium]
MTIGPRSRTFIVGLAAGTVTGYALKTTQTTYQLNTEPSSVNNKQQQNVPDHMNPKYHFPRK